MKLYSGITDLNILLEEISSYLKDESTDYNTSAITTKVKPLFYEVLLTKTYIFYVKKDSFNNSKEKADFKEISKKIIFIEDIKSLVALKKYDENARAKYQISWIAKERFEEIIKNEDSFENKNPEKGLIEKDTFSALKHFQNITFLDATKKDEIDDNTKKMYRIDFEKLESSFSKDVRIPLINLTRHSKKYFYKDIFKIQLSSDKDNSINIIEQVLNPIKYNDIIITKKEQSNVYNYRCQICNKLHQVILSKSQRDKNIASKKYKRVDKQFIELLYDSISGREMYKINCDHKDTEYENIDFSFLFNPLYLEMKDKNLNIDKVFLFIFYNFIYKNGNIEYYEGNSIQKINADKFIKGNLIVRSLKKIIKDKLKNDKKIF